MAVSRGGESANETRTALHHYPGLNSMLEPVETSERGPSTRAAVLARLLVAAVEEAMLYLAHTDNPERDHAIVQSEVRKILEKTGLPGR